MRVDAHLVCPPHYLPARSRRSRERADNVGGVLVTLPTDQTAVSRAIAAPCRTGSGRQLVFSDWHHEAALGGHRAVWVLRRDVFSRVGLFDEELLRTRRRIQPATLEGGGRLLLIPDVVSAYYARRRWRNCGACSSSTAISNSVVRKVGGVMTARQLAPGVSWHHR